MAWCRGRLQHELDEVMQNVLAVSTSTTGSLRDGEDIVESQNRWATIKGDRSVGRFAVGSTRTVMCLCQNMRRNRVQAWWQHGFYAEQQLPSHGVMTGDLCESIAIHNTLIFILPPSQNSRILGSKIEFCVVCLNFFLQNRFL